MNSPQRPWWRYPLSLARRSSSASLGSSGTKEPGSIAAPVRYSARTAPPGKERDSTSSSPAGAVPEPNKRLPELPC
jgi:hypothetical protein